jgi:hypothetical protein
MKMINMWVGVGVLTGLGVYGYWHRWQFSPHPGCAPAVCASDLLYSGAATMRALIMATDGVRRGKREES